MGRLAIKRSGQLTYLPFLVRGRAFAKSVIGLSASRNREMTRCEAQSPRPCANSSAELGEPPSAAGGSGLCFTSSSTEALRTRRSRPRDDGLGRRRLKASFASEAVASFLTSRNRRAAKACREPVKSPCQKSANLATFASLDRRRGAKSGSVRPRERRLGFRPLLAGKRPLDRPLTFERFSPADTLTI
jgi:hypothetical protein